MLTTDTDADDVDDNNAERDMIEAVAQLEEVGEENEEAVVDAVPLSDGELVDD